MAPENKSITFYHVATDKKDFKSFFREGAKTTLSDAKGFYVWSDKTLAENHIRWLNSGFLNKFLLLIVSSSHQVNSTETSSLFADIRCNYHKTAQITFL